MNGQRDISIVFRAVITDLVSGTRAAKAEIKSFGDDVGRTFDDLEKKGENVHQIWKSLFEAFIGVEIITSLKKIAMAADTARETLDVAANSARNFGKSLDPNSMEQWLRKFASAAQGGGYAIDAMRASVERFASLGQDTAQIQRALADATNLAAARNIDLAQATQLVSMALTGHVELLTRYGVITREAAGHIKTVEQAMRALEHATAGDAAKRAEGLAGAFGRASNAIMLLTSTFGKSLVPYFVAGANAVSNLATAFSKLPEWLQKAAAGFTVAFAGLTALGLMLPAVRLSAMFLSNAFSILVAGGTLLFGNMNAVTIAAAAETDVLAALAAGNITAAEAENLLSASTGRQIGLFGLLRNLLIGPIVAAFTGLMSLVRGATLGMFALAGAEDTAIAGFVATVAPVAAVAAAIAGLIAAVLLLTNHWSQAVNAMGTAWGEFVNGILKSGEALKIFFAALALMMNPSTSSMGQSIMGTLVAVKMPKTTAMMDAGMAAIENAIKGAFNAVKGFFGFSPSNVAVPTEPFEGVVPGHGGKHHAAKKKKIGYGNFGPDPVALMRDVLGLDLPQLSTSGLEGKLEAIRHAKAMDEAGGTLTPAKSAVYDDRAAKIKEEIALIQETNSARKLEIDQLLDKMYKSPQLDAQVLKDKDNLRQADIAATKATNERAEADKKLQTVLAQHTTSMLQQLGERAGLQFKPNGGLNWQAVLMQAIEQSKAFADVMKIVNELMQLFAQIIDAFRPVIDLLLKGIAFVANGFIGLWNVMARIVRLFGIHVQLLDKINTDFSDLSQNAAPFIQIVHDIPTLNELASGKISALYPAGTHDANSFAAPITDGLKDPGLGGGILGMLGEILAAVIGLKLITGLFGGGGLSGGLGKLFSFEGKTGAAGLSAFFGQKLFGGLTGPTVAGMLASVAGGALLGNLISKITGGNSTNATIGGAIGGGIGGTLGMFGLAAGPLGALAGAALGAVLGGFFGPKLNAHNNPDMLSPGYGQEMADYQGSGVERAAMNANGQSYTENSQLAQQLGGGEGSFISKWIASVGQTVAQKVLGPLASIFTGDAGGIVGGKNGMLNLANGVSIYWSDLMADAQNAITDIAQAGQGIADALNGVGGNIAGVAGNITRFIDATTNDLAGGISGGGKIIIPHPITAPEAGITSQSVGSGASAGSGGDVTVQIYGDVNGYNDVQQLGKDLALAQERARRMHGWRLDRIAGAPIG